jgi:hypothetical protein
MGEHLSRGEDDGRPAVLKDVDCPAPHPRPPLQLFLSDEVVQTILGERLA